MRQFLPGTLALIAAFLGLMGCAQSRITEPKRTAVEQLLISTAADRALEQAQLPNLDGQTVFIQAAYLQCEDQAYVLGAIRDLLNSHGARLVDEAEHAAVIVEPRSGALSIDRTDSLLGLPKLPVPIPFQGTFESPELHVFKVQKQVSIGRLALLFYERETGEHLHSTGALAGGAHFNFYQVLGYFKFIATDMPEKKPVRRWWPRK